MWSSLATQTAGTFRGFSNTAGHHSRSALDKMVNVAPRSTFSTLSMSWKSGRDDHVYLANPGMIVQHPFGYACSDRSILQRSHHRRQNFSTNDQGGTNDLAQAPNTAPDEFKIPGAETGGRKLAIIFTCTHCETRSVKQFTERSYKHGVVIATCPGCNKKHLIADNLGVFSDENGGWNIEKGMAELGENVHVATNDDVLELSMEDVFSKEAIDKAVKNATLGSLKPDPDSKNGGQD